MKITKWLFLLTLLAFPLGELIRIPLIKDTIIKPLDIMVGLTTAWFFINALIGRHMPKTSLAKPIGFFITVCIMSLIANFSKLDTNEFLIATSYLLRWVAYVGIFFVVASFDKKFKERLILWLTGAGSVIVLLGYVQYIFYPDLRNLYYLGWDEHVYRLFSTFLDPNFAGAYLVLLFIFILSSRDPIKILQNKNHSLFLFLIFILSIFLTYSRSGFMMFLVSCGMFLYLLNKVKTIFLIVAVFVIFIPLGRIQISEGTNLFRTASITSRFDSYQEAVIVIQSSPIFGVGFNAYKYALERQNIDKPTKAIEQHANSSSDSSLLFVFATTGVIGLISYLYLYTSMLRISFMRYKQGNMLALGVFVSLVGLLVNSIFINSLFFPFIMFWIWIQLGLIEKE